jgi:acetyl-CoA carboxylase carboxyl transferase subunit alpha
MDAIVPEPLGGAHADPVLAFPYIKEALLSTYKE